ncbi:MAG: TetR/AcrR family transcriptional regulator [Ilumatobacteraceae bacterium]
MGRPAALNRELILGAAAALVEEHGAEALSARRLGDALGCDPSALYRHFDNMDEVQREVGDRFLAAVHVAPRRNEVWIAAVRRICIELRSVQLQQPRLAALVRAAPTRLRNELHITEALLRELRRGGFTDDGAAAAYHSLIELTVGAAAIDATLAAEPAADRRRAYREWRKAYAALDAVEFPNAVAVADHLYNGTADQRFEWALDALLEGLAARAAR